MSANEQENSDKSAMTERESATERFRTNLRARLGEMRENARRIGASSSYIESLERSSAMVLTAIAAAKSAKEAETSLPEAEAPATRINISEFKTSGMLTRVTRTAPPRPERG
jgi:hypothetical protein